MDPLRPDDPEGYGQYQLLAQLGMGGMGRVFLGRSPSGRLVAVKVLHGGLAGDADFRARFRREITAAGRVSGAFTAAVIDAAPDAPSPWLVTEFLPGVSLQEAVGMHGPLPPNAVMALGASLAEGLTAVHRAGIVHRDLKPSNVLLTPAGPRLIDFGIARPADDGAITQSGVVVGSPGYMAPEQVGQRETGPAEDVFSLAAVMVFAATGTGPFGTGRPDALLYRILHEPPTLHAVADHELRGLLAACLDKDAARRPAVGQVLQWLVTRLPERIAPQGTGWLPQPVAEHLTHVGTRVPQGPLRSVAAPPTAPSPTAPPPRNGLSRRRVLALGAAAVGAAGLAAGGGAWWLVSRSSVDYAWTFDVPDGGEVEVGPVVAGGMVLVATRPGASGSGERTLYAFDARSGEQRWKQRLSGTPFRLPGLVDGLIYMTTVTRELVAMDPKSGKVRWRAHADLKSPAVVAGGGFTYVHGRTPKGDAGVLALTSATGEAKWIVPTGTAVCPDPAFGGGALYVGAGKQLTANVMGQTKARWSRQLDERIVGTPVVGRQGLYVSTERALAAFDLGDGRPLWTFPNPSPKTVTDGWVPSAAGPIVFVAGMSDTLHALNGTDGRELWTFRAGGGLTDGPRPDPRILAPITELGPPIVFNGVDQLSSVGGGVGRAAWQKPIKDPSDLFAAAAGARVHLATKGGVLTFDPSNGALVQHVEDIKAENLVTEDELDLVYFAGGPPDRDRPGTVYAMVSPDV